MPCPSIIIHISLPDLRLLKCFSTDNFLPTFKGFLSSLVRHFMQLQWLTLEKLFTFFDRNLKSPNLLFFHNRFPTMLKFVLEFSEAEIFFIDKREYIKTKYQDSFQNSISQKIHILAQHTP